MDSSDGNEVPRIEVTVHNIKLGEIHRQQDHDDLVDGKNPMRPVVREERFEKKIRVPLPPIDWDGYNDPKYKMHKKLKEEEDEQIRNAQNE
jgi:hypothetical protein